MVNRKEENMVNQSLKRRLHPIVYSPTGKVYKGKRAQKSIPRIKLPVPIDYLQH